METGASSLDRPAADTPTTNAEGFEILSETMQFKRYVRVVDRVVKFSLPHSPQSFCLRCVEGRLHLAMAHGQEADATNSVLNREWHPYRYPNGSEVKFDVLVSKSVFNLTL